MTDGEALLKAILDDPDDDTVRLAYADYLEENGQEDRAKFIRLTCRREMPYTTLLKVHRRKEPHWDITSGGAGVMGSTAMWKAAQQVADDLLPYASNVVIRRGFVQSITCTSEDWMRHGDRITAAHPVRELKLTTPLRGVHFVRLNPNTITVRLPGRNVTVPRGGPREVIAACWPSLQEVTFDCRFVEEYSTIGFVPQVGGGAIGD